MTTALRGALAALSAVALAGILTACGGSEPADGSPPADATRVTVSATEYAYELSTKTVEEGPVVFELTNDGTMPHDLVLEGGPGGGTDIIDPGETDELFVTLEPGTYTLYCSVGNHRALGMEVRITVP